MPKPRTLFALAPLVMRVSLVSLVVGACANPAGIESRAHRLDERGLMARPGDGKANGQVDGQKDGNAAPELPATRWWAGWNDPGLDRLMERALAQSPSLAAAEARFDRVAAIADTAESAGGLSVSLGVDSSRQRFSEHALVPPPYAGSWRTVNQALVNGRYEFDFWGRNRAAVEAATSRLWAARAEASSARLMLSSSIARAWYTLAGHFESRALAERILAQRQENLRLVRQRADAGLDTLVTVKQVEATIPAVRQQIAQIDERIDLARHALAALAGLPAADPLVASARPALPGFEKAGARTTGLGDWNDIPIDVIGRRPEMIAARARVEASEGDMSAARADFYPNLSLAAFAGLSALGFRDWFESGSRTFSFGPALRLPIFENGRLRAGLRAATADHDAAVASYNQALLDAVRDLSDQLGSVKHLDRQVDEQRNAERLANEAYSLALQRYKAGLTTWLTVLSAETQVLEQRRVGIELRSRIADHRVLLVRALGGGIENAAPDDKRKGRPARPDRTPG